MRELAAWPETARSAAGGDGRVGHRDPHDVRRRADIHHLQVGYSSVRGHPARAGTRRRAQRLSAGPAFRRYLRAAGPSSPGAHPTAPHDPALRNREQRAAVAEIREELAQAWRVPVLNYYACSEAGAVAISCHRGGDGLHLADDLLIVEPVSSRGHPVAPGERADKIYITNLFNHTLPLIRYEITDEVTLLDEPCSCGRGHRLIADPQGRLDDTFGYGTVAVHPMSSGRRSAAAAISSNTRSGRPRAAPSSRRSARARPTCATWRRNWLPGSPSWGCHRPKCRSTASAQSADNKAANCSASCPRRHRLLR